MRWKVPAAIVLLVVGVGAVVIAVTGWPGGSRASRAQYLTATAATTTSPRRWSPTGASPGRRPTTSTSASPRRSRTPAATARAATGPGRSPRSRSRSATRSRRATRWRPPTRPRSSATSSRPRASLSAARSQKTAAKKQYADASGTDARRQAWIGYQNAISQYTQAQANVADLEEQIARATIKAPADGTIDAVAAVAGADLSERTRDHPVERRARGHRGLHRERPPVAQDRPVGNRDGRRDRRHGPGQGDRHRTLAGELVEQRLGQRRDLRRDDRADLAACHGATRHERQGDGHDRPGDERPGDPGRGPQRERPRLHRPRRGLRRIRRVARRDRRAGDRRPRPRSSRGLQAGEAVAIGTVADQNATTTSGGGLFPGGGFQRGTGGGTNRGNGGGTTVTGPQP